MYDSLEKKPLTHARGIDEEVSFLWPRQYTYEIDKTTCKSSGHPSRDPMAEAGAPVD